jgi:acetyl esterase/lipase
MNAAPRLGGGMIVETRETAGHKVFTIRPRGRDVRRHIFYLHGGGYVSGPSVLHWRLIARFARTFDARCVVPRYPLAPATTCEEGMAFVSAAYHELVAEVGAENIVVAGDSAGGGLALALLQHTGLKPAGLILNAPWLDVSVCDPSQPALERDDFLLNCFVLRTWGQWWAGTRDVRDPLVSPLFGDLARLPKTLVLCGSHDVLVADSRRLAAAAPDKVEYIEEAGMMHAYPLFYTFPETKRAWREMQRFVASL